MSQQIRRNPQRHAIDSPSCDTAVSRRAAIQAAFAAAGAAVLFGLPRLAGAEPQASQETTDKLNNAQAQLDDAQEQLDEISSQFEDLSRQLDDTLGQIVNQLYRVFIEAFREIVHSLVDGLIDQSETLRQVGELYQNTSEAATALSSLVGKDY